jgi:hypothetical protein
MPRTGIRPLPTPRPLSHELWFSFLASPVALWICVAFGVMCGCASRFLPGWNPAAEWHLAWETREARGRITEVRETRVQEDDVVAVYRYAYRFELPDGTTRHGVCYATGWLAPEELPPGGHDVLVEYHPVHVWANRIWNARPSPRSFSLMFLILPGIPLALYLLVLLRARRYARLLRDGELTDAWVLGFLLDRNPKDSDSALVLYSREEAAAFPQDGSLNYCEFEFQAAGQTIRATGSVPFTTEILSQPELPVIYDPHRPADALLLADMEVRLGRNGEWEPTEKRAPRLLVALAVISVLGGVYLMWLGSQQPVGLR